MKVRLTAFQLVREVTHVRLGGHYGFTFNIPHVPQSYNFTRWIGNYEIAHVMLH